MRASLVLILVVAASVDLIESAPAGPCAVSSLIKHIVPLNYSQHMRLHKDSVYTGNIIYTLDVLESKTDEPKNLIAFHLDKDVEVKEPVFLHDINRQITDICRDELNQLVVLKLAEDLPSREWVLMMGVKGPVRDGNKGFYKHTPVEGDNSIVKVDYSDGGVRMAIPSYDDPKYKASFDLSIWLDKSLVATSSVLQYKGKSSLEDDVLYDFFPLANINISEVKFEIRPVD